MKKLLSGFFSSKSSPVPSQQPKDSSKDTPKASNEEFQKLPLNGIQLKYLKEQIVPQFPTQNCYQICEDLVKKTTSTLSFCDHLSNDPKTKCFVKDKADIFVSYAWGYVLKELIDTLYDSGLTDDTFVWLDLFVMNQNLTEGKEESFEFWAERFTTALKKVGKAVIVVHDWVNPIPVSRSWCVFEYSTIILNGINYNIVMSRKDEEDFKKSIRAQKNGC